MLTEKEKEFYEKIKLEEPGITAAIRSISQKYGIATAGLNYRLKTVDSLDEKIHGRNEEEDIHNLNDIIRFTYIIPQSNYGKITKDIIEYMSTEPTLDMMNTKVKNFWLDDSNPYQGINTQFITDTGIKFEIQFHTNKSFEAKELAHQYYELARVLPVDDSRKQTLNDMTRLVEQDVSIPNDVAYVGTTSIQQQQHELICKMKNLIKGAKNTNLMILSGDGIIRNMPVLLEKNIPFIRPYGKAIIYDSKYNQKCGFETLISHEKNNNPYCMKVDKSNGINLDKSISFSDNIVNQER